MEDTGHIFWKNMETMMKHLTHMEQYHQLGKIIPLHSKALSGDLVHFGGYSWIVLCIDAEESKCLLVASRLLPVPPRAYHKEKTEVTWENSHIREYLNKTFYNKLYKEDKGKVLETTLANPQNPWFETAGGGDTTDKVFLLNLDEVTQYLGDSGQLAKKSWRIDGIDHSKPCFIKDEYDNLRSAKNEFGEPFPYWLRTGGRSGDMAAIVRADGTIDLDGQSVEEVAGIRPAIWVKI
jgi:hypothetical protein